MSVIIEFKALPGVKLLAVAWEIEHGCDHCALDRDEAGLACAQQGWGAKLDSEQPSRCGAHGHVYMEAPKRGN